MQTLYGVIADRKTGADAAAGGMMYKGVQKETAAQQQDQKYGLDLSE